MSSVLLCVCCLCEFVVVAITVGLVRFFFFTDYHCLYLYGNRCCNKRKEEDNKEKEEATQQRGGRKGGELYSYRAVLGVCLSGLFITVSCHCVINFSYVLSSMMSNKN